MKQSNKASAVVAYCMAYRGFGYKELAKYLGISESTGYKRTKDVDSFRRNELMLLTKDIPLSEQQVRDLLGA